MHVVLRHIGQFEIDDMRQILDVQTASRHFGGHQCRDLARLEVRQRAGPGVLALVAMNGARPDAAPFQLLRQAVGSMLGAGEHQHLMPVTFVDQVGEQVPLVFLRNPVHLLLDAVGGGIAGRDFNVDRVPQDALGELPNVIRVGGREHEILTLRRQQLDDAADGVDEAHVEHPIGFVQHQALYCAEVECALLDQVEQAARCSNQQVAAAVQGTDLRLQADTAEHDDCAQSGELTVAACALSDLSRQFTCRCQNERARQTSRNSVELLQDGQHEGGGLAGAGLGAGEHVAAGKNRGNGLGLDGSGVGVAFFGQGTQQLGLQPEIGKCHSKASRWSSHAATRHRNGHWRGRCGVGASVKPPGR